MTNYDLYRMGVDIVTLGIVPAGYGFFKLLNKIKTNDLQHIDDKLNDIKATVEKTDEKLDRHLEWHLNQKEQ